MAQDVVGRCMHIVTTGNAAIQPGVVETSNLHPGNTNEISHMQACSLPRGGGDYAARRATPSSTATSAVGAISNTNAAAPWSRVHDGRDHGLRSDDMDLTMGVEARCRESKEGSWRHVSSGRSLAVP